MTAVASALRHSTTGSGRPIGWQVILRVSPSWTITRVCSSANTKCRDPSLNNLLQEILFYTHHLNPVGPSQKFCLEYNYVSIKL